MQEVWTKILSFICFGNELIIEAVVKHDLPFSFVEYEGIRAIFNYMSPELHLPSRNTVKNHVARLYEIEKSKMQGMLTKANGRICLTLDLWSSHTTDGYLALTAHFIDSNWKLQKRLLNFCHMPPPHTGSALAEKINTLICEWRIDTNLFSITLDNAPANNSCVDMLKTQLNLRRLLLLNGKFFHDFDSSCIEGTSSSVKNELASYLDDKNLERKLEIDVLDWWKKRQFKYPVLSRLASDMLSIPVSTVTSESAFSIGGRVIDQYRSSLLPETVEALLCVRDWLYDKKCEDSSVVEILAEDVLHFNISQGIELE